MPSPADQREELHVAGGEGEGSEVGAAEACWARSPAPRASRPTSPACETSSQKMFLRIRFIRASSDFVRTTRWSARSDGMVRATHTRVPRQQTRERRFTEHRCWTGSSSNSVRSLANLVRDERREFLITDRPDDRIRVLFVNTKRRPPLGADTWVHLRDHARARPVSCRGPRRVRDRSRRPTDADLPAAPRDPRRRDRGGRPRPRDRRRLARLEGAGRAQPWSRRRGACCGSPGTSAGTGSS